MFAIRNTRTMAFLRKGQMEYLLFNSIEGARAYILKHNLNPHCFEIVPMLVRTGETATDDPKKVPLKHRRIFK